ncbi:hypothetical protein BGW38_006647 [Lunasporangiospora selenospora]|uniref:Uncharacterized protein n=1 Tax=Lunasporangiospora selenospora TaxID=979761 RepID=A0A9P6FZN9_9FUNG|nr:hypothetical protein BGW38_006647 [Lunasporangiospora selenospora]
MVVGGSLLLMVLFYYVVLPEPYSTSTSASAVDPQPNVDLETSFENPKAGGPRLVQPAYSPLSEDKEDTAEVDIMPPPKVKSFKSEDNPRQKDKNKGKKAKDKNKAAKDGLRANEGDRQSAKAWARKSKSYTGSFDLGASPILEETDDALNVDYSNNHDSENGDNESASSVEDDSSTWTVEKELESVQEEDDDQGEEREDGKDQEVVEELEEAIDLAEERLEVDEAVLEEAIEELEEKRLRMALPSKNSRRPKGKSASQDDGDGGDGPGGDRGYEEEDSKDEVDGSFVLSTSKSSSPGSQKGRKAVKNDPIEEDLDAKVENIFNGDDDNYDESVDKVRSEEDREYEEKYARVEDRLGQAGPLETMDDED